MGLETLLLRTSEMSKCAREEEEMWRPYAAVVSLLWLLLLINGAAMCCQVASAPLSALSIHREKLHPAVSTSVHLAGHDGNRERRHVFNVEQSRCISLVFINRWSHYRSNISDSIHLKENKLKYVYR